MACTRTPRSCRTPESSEPEAGFSCIVIARGAEFLTKCPVVSSLLRKLNLQTRYGGRPTQIYSLTLSQVLDKERRPQPVRRDAIRVTLRCCASCSGWSGTLNPHTSCMRTEHTKQQISEIRSFLDCRVSYAIFSFLRGNLKCGLGVPESSGLVRDGAA